MNNFDSTFADPDKKHRFPNYFRPAKYLIPATVFAAMLTVGCDDPGTSDDGTDDTGGDNNGTIPTALFKAPVELTLNNALSSISYYVFQPALADIDADGDLDVFLGNTYNYTSYWSFSSNIYSDDNIYQTVRFYRNGEIPAARSITALNLDEAAFSSLPENFLYTSEMPVHPAGPMFTAVGDIDGDGDLEIIAAANTFSSYSYSSYYSSYYPARAVYSSSPSGFFEARFFTYNYSSGLSNVSYTYSSSVVAPALVDLDGDGDLDLVLGVSYFSAPAARALSSSLNAEIFYMLNGGDNSGSGNGDFYPYTVDGTLATLPTNVSVPFLPVPAFVDVDEDGDQDMFVTLYSYEGAELKFYRNTGSASIPDFTEETIPSDFAVLVNSSTVYFPAFGDADGDGDIDIIVGTNEPKLLFFENTTVE